jgi:hypothetical protein
MGDEETLMFRSMRITWKVLRALPLIAALAFTAYTTAYFTLPQERVADEEGRIVRLYESQALDHVFEPATLVENQLLDWWHNGRSQAETHVQKHTGLAIEAP